MHVRSARREAYDVEQTEAELVEHYIGSYVGLHRRRWRDEPASAFQTGEREANAGEKN